VKHIGNAPASFRQRLLNLSRKDRRPFNELLQYYAMERFLYRLSVSSHRNRFILKGALMLQVWHPTDLRPTMDIDMLGVTSNDTADIIDRIGDILSSDVEEDGLLFDRDSIRSERITEDADYSGIRVRFQGELDGAKIGMQIDIGFGDAVYPDPEEIALPTMFDSPAAMLRGYTRESAIAEKLEAMVKLGELNSRMKDFYDIWLLARSSGFEGAVLAKAVRLTFERRGTILPVEIEAFSGSFIDSKQTQWTAFRNRLAPGTAPESFGDVVAVLTELLGPIIASLNSDNPPPATWSAGGPWT